MTNLPVSGNFQVTATYGQKGKHWANGHQGIDFTAEDKTIYATCDGTVRVVAYDLNGWGRYITIGDTEGNIHIFCHLERNSVLLKNGDKVNRSTIIGVMGTTGNSTGVHLHYQINNSKGIPINPCKHLEIPNEKGIYNSKDFEIKGSDDMKFNDSDKISKWAKDAVDNVTDLGLMKGVGNGHFDPQGTVTREQLAVVLDNALKKGYMKK